MKNQPLDEKGYFLRGLSVLIGFTPLLAYVVAPSDFIIFQWMGLLMPVLLLVNFVVFILTIVLWKFDRILFLLNILIWICFLPLMFQYNGNGEVKNRDLVICSYNVRGMRSDYGFSTLDGVVELSKQHKIDVLCLQEVPAWYTEDKLLEAFDNMKYVIHNKSVDGVSKSLVVLSKYPLKSLESIANYEREFAMISELDVNGEKVALVNCHLQTTNWNQIKNMPSLTFSDKLATLFDNSIVREDQVLLIQDYVYQIDKPVVLVGDFNDTPVSFSYHTLKSNLKDSFREAGNGYGYTYRHLMKLFRIDYIFYDKNKFKALNYQTIDLDYSDHLPIKVDLVLQK